VPADIVIDGTPVTLKNILRIKKPIVNVEYDFKQVKGPKLERLIWQKLCGIK